MVGAQGGNWTEGRGRRKGKGKWRKGRKEGERLSRIFWKIMLANLNRAGPHNKATPQKNR